MFYAELKDKNLRLAFGKDVQEAVSWSLEHYGEDLEAVYKDNQNDPFIKVWETSETSL